MKPIYKVWHLTKSGWWVRLPSDYPDRVEFDWVDSWPRTLASVDSATLNLLPPTLAAYAATVVRKRVAVIPHGQESDWFMMSVSSVSMVKESTDHPVNMITSCCQWVNTLFGKAVGNSPSGRYCRFCGNNIAMTPAHHTLAFSSDTTSFNGRSSYPKTGHASYSLTMVSLPVRLKFNHGLTHTLTRWWSKQIQGCGRLTLWRDADGNFAPTPTTGPPFPIFAETEHAKRR